MRRVLFSDVKNVTNQVRSHAEKGRDLFKNVHPAKMIGALLGLVALISMVFVVFTGCDQFDLDPAMQVDADKLSGIENIYVKSLDIRTSRPQISHPMEIFVTIGATQEYTDVEALFFMVEAQYATDDVEEIPEEAVHGLQTDPIPVVKKGEHQYICRVILPLDIDNSDSRMYRLVGAVDVLDEIEEIDEDDNVSNLLSPTEAPAFALYSEKLGFPDIQLDNMFLYSHVAVLKEKVQPWKELPELEPILLNGPAEIISLANPSQDVPFEVYVEDTETGEKRSVLVRDPKTQLFTENPIIPKLSENAPTTFDLKIKIPDDMAENWRTRLNEGENFRSQLVFNINPGGAVEEFEIFSDSDENFMKNNVIRKTILVAKAMPNGPLDPDLVSYARDDTVIGQYTYFDEDAVRGGALFKGLERAWKWGDLWGSTSDFGAEFRAGAGFAIGGLFDPNNTTNIYYGYGTAYGQVYSNLYIFGLRWNIFGLELYGYFRPPITGSSPIPPPNAKGGCGIVLLGLHLYTWTSPDPYKFTFEFNYDRLQYSKEKKKEKTFTIGPVPVYVMGHITFTTGLEGAFEDEEDSNRWEQGGSNNETDDGTGGDQSKKAKVDWDYGTGETDNKTYTLCVDVGARAIQAGVKPFARLEGGARGGVGGGCALAKAAAGVGCDITIFDIGVPVTGMAQLKGLLNNLDLDLGMEIELTLDALKGRFFLWAEVCFLFYCDDYDQTIFSWSGFNWSWKFFTLSATYPLISGGSPDTFPSSAPTPSGWYKADEPGSGAGYYGNKSHNTTWYDKSGNNNHLNAASGVHCPEYYHNRINGKPAFWFAGNDWFSNGLSMHEGSIIMVFRSQNYYINSNGGLASCGNGGDAGWYLWQDSSKEWAPTIQQLGSDRRWRKISYQRHPKANTWNVVSATITNNSVQIRMNGAELDEVDKDETSTGFGNEAQTSTTANSVFNIGAKWGGPFFFGDIAEIVVYKCPVWDPHIIAIENYLMSKYKIDPDNAEPNATEQFKIGE